MTALSMHAAFFCKKQNAVSTIDNAIKAISGGQWGYSAISEPKITTVMRGQSVFYSNNQKLDLNNERINELCILMHNLGNRKNLTVFSSLYALTIHSEDTFVSISDISKKVEMPEKEVSKILKEDLFSYVCERNGKYRIKGNDMVILPILSILRY